MDDIELDNLDKPEKEPEEQQEQETNIDDDDWRDQSIVIIDTSNSDAEIPNPRKDAGVIRRAYTEDKKSLLREIGININKGDGPSAKAVFEKLKVTVNRKGRVNGAEYDGTRMKAQDGEDVGEYKLTDMHLEYEIIESEDLVREVKDQYSVGRSLGYDYTTMLKTLPWNKSSTREVIDINIPRKSMEALVLLLTKNAGDSKDFVFPELKRVNVSVEGNPNDIYSEGLAKRDIYREAVRFSGSSTCEKYLGSKCVSRRKFYTDKFAYVIDFRTVDDKNVSGSGRKLIGMQAGILLEIEKDVTTTDNF